MKNGPSFNPLKRILMLFLAVETSMKSISYVECNLLIIYKALQLLRTLLNYVQFSFKIHSSIYEFVGFITNSSPPHNGKKRRSLEYIFMLGMFYLHRIIYYFARCVYLKLNVSIIFSNIQTKLCSTCSPSCASLPINYYRCFSLKIIISIHLMEKPQQATSKALPP